MSDVFMNTKEVAEYLGIHEKQVYALIKAGRMPATRVTGKWIFPRRLIDDWIETQARAGLGEARQKVGRVQGALLAAGSNDPALDLLLASVQAAHSEFYIFSSAMGSTAGLRALGGGYTDVAWSHLYDPAVGDYNTPDILAPYLRDFPFVVVHLFSRELALIAPQGNPLAILDLEDVWRRRLRIVNRQPGAGTRVYLDHLLKGLDASPDELPGYNEEVFTHMDVGLAVLAGRADTGLATTAVARMLGLHAIPLTTECFSMVLAQGTFFLKGVQALIEVLRSRPFQEKARGMGGYDFKDAGRVSHAAP
jgi:excisionase family DNA binding protein